MRGLVLILLGIQFEFKELGQIARGSATAASAALRSKRNLNLAEGGFSAQQKLERLLLIGNSVLPLLPLQLLGRRLHGLRRGQHILLEIADGLHFVGQFARLQAAG